MARRLETLVDGIVFGEGPRWHAGRLFFSDIKGHRVEAVDPGGGRETIVELSGEPSGLGWLPDGRLLVVSMEDRRLLRLDPEGLREVADLSPHCGGKANDMVVDAKGRAYVGNIGFDLEAQPIEPRPTRLVRVDPEDAVWVASPTTREFLRVREGGEVADRIPTGERVAIACALGGPARRTLFLVTSTTMSLAEAARECSGRIETCEVAVPGAGWP